MTKEKNDPFRSHIRVLRLTDQNAVSTEQISASLTGKISPVSTEQISAVSTEQISAVSTEQIFAYVYAFITK